MNCQLMMWVNHSGGTLGTVDIDGVQHSYIEMSGPFDVGFVSSQWMDFSELVSIYDM